MRHLQLWVSVYKTILAKLVQYKNNISEVIETLSAIQTGKLVAGSPARVADCCPQPVDPFQCVFKQGGICTAAEYPKTTGQCIPNKCKPFATVITLIYSLKHSLTLPTFYYTKNIPMNFLSI
jgi:hypothetical protein